MPPRYFLRRRLLAVGVGFEDDSKTFFRWLALLVLVAGPVTVVDPEAWWVGVIGGLLLAWAVHLVVSVALDHPDVPGLLKRSDGQYYFKPRCSQRRDHRYIGRLREEGWCRERHSCREGIRASSRDRRQDLTAGHPGPRACPGVRRPASLSPPRSRVLAADPAARRPGVARRLGRTGRPACRARLPRRCRVACPSARSSGSRRRPGSVRSAHR